MHAKLRFLSLIFVTPLLSFVIYSQSKNPQTVRDYFMLLPQAYFQIESCNTDIIKDCTSKKMEYLDRFLKVEDTRNGYFEGSGDGSQESFKMTLFKRPNRTFIVGLFVFGEWGEKYNFLEYKNRKWFNVSRSVIPGYKRSNVYELPQIGTTIKVFERLNFDKENNFGEQGRKLYELAWKNGVFSVRK